MKYYLVEEYTGSGTESYNVELVITEYNTKEDAIQNYTSGDGSLIIEGDIILGEENKRLITE